MQNFLRVGLLLAALAWAAPHALATPMVIRTAAQNSQPKFILQGNTMEGLCVDLFRAIERIDPDLKFGPMQQFLPMARIERQLAEGDIDVFCGLAKTPAREARFEFVTIPIYVTHSVLAARKDDKADIRGFDDLRKLGEDGVVLVVSKTVHAEVLAAQPGIKFYDTATSTSDNLRLLLLGRGRFIFHSEFTLADEIKRDQLGDKVKLLPFRFVMDGRYLVVSRKAPAAMREKLRQAMEKLQANGQLLAIFKSYDGK